MKINQVRLILFTTLLVLLSLNCLPIPQNISTTLSVTTFQSTYDLTLPEVEGCLITVIHFYLGGLTSLNYSSIHRGLPNILVFSAFVFQNTLGLGSNQSWIGQFRPSSPLCQIYIFVEPPNSSYLQVNTISRVAFHPTSIFLVILPKSQESELIYSFQNWDHEIFNYLDLYEASLYFLFSGKISTHIFLYCYPTHADVLVPMTTISLGESFTCNPGLKGIFQGLLLHRKGDCVWGYRGNLCEYTMRLLTLTEDWMNFTTLKVNHSFQFRDTRVSRIHVAHFIQRHGYMFSTVVVDDSKDFMIFYCKKLEFVGSYWHRWTAVWDWGTWFCLATVVSSLYIFLLYTTKSDMVSH